MVMVMPTNDLHDAGKATLVPGLTCFEHILWLQEAAKGREQLRRACVALAEGSWRLMLPALSLLLGRCYGEALSLKLLKVSSSSSSW